MREKKKRKKEKSGELNAMFVSPPRGGWIRPKGERRKRKKKEKKWEERGVRTLRTVGRKPSGFLARRLLVDGKKKKRKKERGKRKEKVDLKD